MIQAGSGISSLVAKVKGAPDYLPTVICDKLAGQAMAYSILAALFQRANGGGGQSIEVPMFETSIDFFTIEHLSGTVFVPPMGQMGFKRIMSPDRRPFRTADGYACILPYSDRNWRDFFIFAGRPELADEPRYRKLSQRVDHIAELYGLIAQTAVRHTTAEWVAFCDSVSIPCMPVLDIDALDQNEHVRAVELFQEADHPSEGRYRYVRSPITLSGSDFEMRRHTPRQGEQSREILAEAGLSASEIERLIEAGVVLTPDVEVKA